MLQGASQQKGSLDSRQQGSKHSTEIQGWGHYSEKTIQTPHFDPQTPQSEAHLTWGQSPLQSAWFAHRRLPLSEYVKFFLSLRPQYRLLLLPGRPALHMAASLSSFLRSQLNRQLLSGYPIFTCYPFPNHSTLYSSLPVPGIL